jgi:hypothetical protein
VLGETPDVELVDGEGTADLQSVSLYLFSVMSRAVLFRGRASRLRD